MNSRTTAATAIVFFGILFSIIIGIKAAKFANETANESQNRVNAAFAILDK